MKIVLSFVFLSLATLAAPAASEQPVYQWRAGAGSDRQAFLWVPENCRAVKAVLFANENMDEETLFAMSSFRAALEERLQAANLSEEDLASIAKDMESVQKKIDLSMSAERFALLQGLFKSMGGDAADITDFIDTLDDIQGMME